MIETSLHLVACARSFVKFGDPSLIGSMESRSGAAFGQAKLAAKISTRWRICFLNRLFVCSFHPAFACAVASFVAAA